MSYVSCVRYTCFPGLSYRRVAHLHMFSKLELYTIYELLYVAHELSGVYQHIRILYVRKYKDMIHINME